MAGNTALILAVILAAAVFAVQMVLFQKTEKKVFRMIPLFLLLLALVIAFIISVPGFTEEHASRIPLALIIKDTVMFCMVGDLLAVAVNKIMEK